MSKIQTTAELVGHVLEAAGQNDLIQAAGSELAKSAHTITRTINNVLLPLAAINYAFDRARAYFADQFFEDLASKLAHVPADAIQEPPAIIAGRPCKV